MTDHDVAASPDAISIKTEHAKNLRRLLHDMNNGLEIIIQASYLIGTLDIPADGKQWVTLLDQGVQQVAALNLQLREAIRKAQEPEN